MIETIAMEKDSKKVKDFLDQVNETISSCVNLKLKIITLSFDVCLGCFGDAGSCSAAGSGHSYSFLLFTIVLIRLFH